MRWHAGIASLDHLLNGGVLPNASIMVEGTPGTGKSTLGLQFIAEGVKRGELKKSLSIIKMRGSEHDPSMRELIFTSTGLKVGPPFENLSGLLTGVPTAERPVAFEAYFGEVTPEQERIVSVLAARKEATVAEAAQAAGMGVGRTQELLEGLVRSGFVTAVEVKGEVRYRATLRRAR